MKNLKPQMNMQKNIRRSFWGVFFLFFILVIYFIFLTMINGKKIASKSINKRLAIMDTDRQRGTILTSDGIILAESDPYTKERQYPMKTMAAHVIGYTSQARLGVELTHNFTMQNLHLECIQWIKFLATGKTPVGNSVFLTVDSRIQKEAEKRLDKAGKGSIIVMEVDTGKIIALASNPSFDPGEVSAHWDELNDPANVAKPLLNRGTNGLYEPGSTMKIVVALSALEMDKAYLDFSIVCQGAAYFGDHAVHCFKKTAHGEVNMENAMAKSCNIYFAYLGEELGANRLQATAEKLFFNGNISGEPSMSQSQFALNETSELREIVDSSFGQGRTLVSPLHMLLITASIANGGVMMKPYVVEKINSAEKTITEIMPQKEATITDIDTAFTLSTLLEAVVEKGTGGAVKGDVSVAGKTGTAENPSGKDHSWFVSYAPVDNPKYAICTLLEESGVSNEGQKISKSLYQLLFE